MLITFLVTILCNHTQTVAIHGLQLLPREQAVSLTSCTLGSSGESNSTYYVVGTALVNPNDKEPSIGRILVIQVTSSKYYNNVRRIMYVRNAYMMTVHLYYDYLNGSIIFLPIGGGIFQEVDIFLFGH